jgi:hypothetical protein
VRSNAVSEKSASRRRQRSKVTCFNFIFPIDAKAGVGEVAVFQYDVGRRRSCRRDPPRSRSLPVRRPAGRVRNGDPSASGSRISSKRRWAEHTVGRNARLARRSQPP